MSNPAHDKDSLDYDDDEKFYEETVYNEHYYSEREQELIRESNLEIENEELEEEFTRDMQVEALLQPTFVQLGENNSEQTAPTPVNPSDDLGDLPF